MIDRFEIVGRASPRPDTERIIFCDGTGGGIYRPETDPDWTRMDFRKTKKPLAKIREWLQVEAAGIEPVVASDVTAPVCACARSEVDRAARALQNGGGLFLDRQWLTLNGTRWCRRGKQFRRSFGVQFSA